MGFSEASAMLKELLSSPTISDVMQADAETQQNSCAATNESVTNRAFKDLLSSPTIADVLTMPAEDSLGDIQSAILKELLSSPTIADVMQADAEEVPQKACAATNESATNRTFQDLLSSPTIADVLTMPDDGADMQSTIMGALSSPTIADVMSPPEELPIEVERLGAIRNSQGVCIGFVESPTADAERDAWLRRGSTDDDDFGPDSPTTSDSLKQMFSMSALSIADVFTAASVAQAPAAACAPAASYAPAARRSGATEARGNAPCAQGASTSSACAANVGRDGAFSQYLTESGIELYA